MSGRLALTEGACNNMRAQYYKYTSFPGWVSKGNPLARDCIQSVTCLMENGGIALNCTKFR